MFALHVHIFNVSIHKVYNESYFAETYEKGTQLAKRAEDTSNVESDEGSDEGLVKLSSEKSTRKRKIHVPSRFMSTDEEYGK
jgi:hypothetical protein